jgi:hypothetical protein
MLYLLIFGVAFLPRIISLGFDVFNTDAFFWRENTYNFMGLLEKQQWADTAITHHPGVILMWLGGLGMKVFRGSYFLLNQTPAPDTQSTVLWLNFWQILPIALVTTLTIVFTVYLLARFRQGLNDNRQLAAVVGLLLATEPWFIAHSRVFNTDALMVCFMFLSVLCLWLAVREERLIKWSALSGVFAGLALLTKSISLFLIPFTILTLGLALVVKKVKVTKVIKVLVLFFVFCFLLFVLLWPAMWVNLVPTLTLYFKGIFLEGDTRLNLHNMFGHPTLNPGPVFYPLVFLFRFTPEMVMLSVIGFFGIAKILLKEYKEQRSFLYWVLSLVSFIVFYTIELSLAAKKLDRYLLPILPFIAIFSAFGFLTVVNFLKKRWGRVVTVLAVSTLVMYRLAVLGFYFPDYLAYYDPLLGGPTQGYNFDGEWWGEGYHKVGDWINERLEIGMSVAAYDQRQLRPLIRDDIAVYDAGDKNLDPAKVDYWVLRYRENGQREGYQLVKTIYVANYPMWGVYRKL